MTASVARSYAHSDAATASAQHPVVRSRKLAAGILTALTAVFSVGFIAYFGAFAAFVMAVTLPMPLLLLWSGAEVLRSDEVKP